MDPSNYSNFCHEVLSLLVSHLRIDVEMVSKFHALFKCTFVIEVILVGLSSHRMVAEWLLHVVWLAIQFQNQYQGTMHT